MRPISLYRWMVNLCFFLVSGIAFSHGLKVEHLKLSEAKQEANEVDLVVHEITVDFDSLVLGSKYTFNTRIRNAGTGYSNAFYISYHLSSDTILDDNDLPIGTDYHFPLGAGLSGFEESIDWKVPADSSIGDYYILVQADVHLDIDEQDEENNVGHYKVTFINRPSSDVSIDTVSFSKESYHLGEYVRLVVTLENTHSNGQSGGFNTTEYLSLDNSLDESDILLENLSRRSIAAGEAYEATRFINIPGETNPGDYFLIFLADQDSVLHDLNRINNKVAVPLMLEESIPNDLVVNNFGYRSNRDSTFSQGEQLQVFFDLENLGSHRTSNLYSSVYLSLDTLLDETDSLILDVFSFPLAGFESDRVYSGYFGLQEDLALGEYYLLVEADSRMEEEESNEENNVLSLPLTVVPPRSVDLVVNTVSIESDSVELGAEYTITTNIGNTGTKPSSFFRIAYYLSSDTLLDDQDQSLGNDLVWRVEDGGISTDETLEWAVPSDATKGIYYLLVMADSDESEQESDETNNVGYKKIIIRDRRTVDVAIDTAYLDKPSYYHNERPLLNINVENLPSEAETGDFKVGVYFSQDNMLSVDDSLLNEFSIYNIAVGQGTSRALFFSFPDTLEAGTYYVIIKADLNDKLNDVDLSNNIETLQVEVQRGTPADLTIASTSFNTSTDSSFWRNELIDVRVDLQNLGTAIVEDFYVGVYLSDDDLLSADDTLIDDVDIFRVQSLATYRLYTSFLLPQEIDFGSYHLFFEVDSRHDIEEPDETNNVISVPIEVVEGVFPDIVVNSITPLKDTLVIGSFETIETEVENIGVSTTFRSFDVKLYISTDSLLNSGDRRLDVGSVWSLRPGETDDEDFDMYIPSGLEAGEYYLLVYADSDSDVIELNEGNNVAYHKIVITERPMVDIRVDSVYLEKEVYHASEQMKITVELTNIYSESPTGSFYIGSYLSTDSTLDETDVLLTGQTVNSLSTFEKHTGVDFGDIETNTPAGDYYLIVYADYLEVLPELDTSNNFGIVPLEIKASLPPDVVVDSIWYRYSENTYSPGDRFDLFYDVANLGSEDADWFFSGIYLSTDSILDIDDVLLDEERTYGLSGFETETEFSWSIQVPNDIEFGDYYIIVDADNRDEAGESDENNNAAFISLIVVPEPQPDILVSDMFTSDDIVTMGSSLTISAYLTNIGNTHTNSGFFIRYYISNDSIFDDGDGFLGSDYVSRLYPGDTSSEERLVWNVPDDSSAGVYYVLVVSDPNDYSDESNEENNVGYREIYLVDEIPDHLNLWNGVSWSKGQRPIPTDSAVIAGNYYSSVHGGFATGDLTVFGGDTLFLDAPGTHVVVEDTLVNDGTIEVKSGAGLVTKGGVSEGEYYFERVTTFNKRQAKYSMMGSPVEAGNTSDLGKIVYKYDETIKYDTTAGVEGVNRFIRVSNAGEVMTPGRGYFSAYTGTVMMKGKPNHGDITYDLSRTDHSLLEADDAEDDYEGFHVVANPYPAAISLHKFIDENADNIQGTIWVWDDGGSNSGRRGNSDYLTINALGVSLGGSTRRGAWNSHIGSFQGFFVKANHATALKFTDSMKVTGNNRSEAFFRTKSAYQTLKLGLSADGDHQYETLIGFTEDATDGVDERYDAPLINSGLKNQVFTSIHQVAYAIQAVGLDHPVVSVGVALEKDALYTLSLSELDIDRTQTVYLTDHFTGEKVVLTDGDYEFFGTEGVYKERFTLQIGDGGVVAGRASFNSELQVFSANQTLFVKSKSVTHLESIKVFNLKGELVEKFEQVELGESGWEHVLALDGIYIVAVVSDDAMKILKVRF